MEINIEELEILGTLIEMKKNNPEKYKEYMEGLKDVIKDFTKLTKELSEEFL